jgi:hypothetical protein
MKFTHVEKAMSDSENQVEWKTVLLKPFLLGVAFGTGCYIAKVILNCPIMSDIMKMAEKGARFKRSL